MEELTRAVEIAGLIDAEHRLRLDEPIPLMGPARVRVIILIPEPEDAAADEIEEAVWLRLAMTNPVFEFLSDPAEDIYTIEDGNPIDGHGQG